MYDVFGHAQMDIIYGLLFVCVFESVFDHAQRTMIKLNIHLKNH